MSDAAVVEKVDDTETVVVDEKAADKTKESKQEQAKGSDDKAIDKSKTADAGFPAEFEADPNKSDAENEAALVEWEKEKAKSEVKSDIPDNWRELASNGDEDTMKLLKRYGSLAGVAKALKSAHDVIRSGKVKQDMPDPKDEKAMAEWRKAEGIPDDPTGYSLPDTVTKRLTDDDKPILSQFTEFAHAKNARPDVVAIGAEWYTDYVETMREKQLEDDAGNKDEAETELRKDWSHGDYKTNTSLAKRFAETIPGLGADALEFRVNGRRLGDTPEFIQWAADQGRSHFGDLSFADGDSERRHTARREEIEKIRNTDFDRYEREGLDKELKTLIEKDLKRGKK